MEKENMSEIKYKRILLKLSGEALAGKSGYGINVMRLNHCQPHQGSVRHGGGDRRGDRCRQPMARQTGTGARHGPCHRDYMGMLGTVMNALIVMDALERAGVYTRVMSAIEMRAIAEPYIRRRAIRHLEKGRVVIFSAGTGIRIFQRIPLPPCERPRSARMW
jgi:uridylate kinase